MIQLLIISKRRVGKVSRPVCPIELPHAVHRRLPQTAGLSLGSTVDNRMETRTVQSSNFLALHCIIYIFVFS